MASIRAICCRLAYFVLPIICPVGVDIDEAPGTIAGIGGVLVGLTQEMEIGHAFLEIVEGLRVVAGLVVVEANGAGILIAAPDGFLFDAATVDGGAHLEYGEAGSDHDQHQPQAQKERRSRIPGRDDAGHCARCRGSGAARSAQSWARIRERRWRASGKRRKWSGVSLVRIRSARTGIALAGWTIGTVAWRPEEVSSTSAESLPILSSR